MAVSGSATRIGDAACHQITLGSRVTVVLSLLEYRPGERLMEMANEQQQQQQQSGVPVQKAKLDAEVRPASCYLCNYVVSQSRVATQIRCGGMFDDHFTTNLLMKLPMKEF